MARHEFEIGADANLPLLAKLSAKYKVAWEGRAQTYLDDLAESTSLNPGQIEARCHAHPTLTDMVVQGGNRAGEVEDLTYRRTLSSLAAAAFVDEASIDEASLLHSQLINLEPAHLRVLQCLRETLGEPRPDDPDEPGSQYYGEHVRDFSLMYERGFLTQTAILAVLQGLEATGMVARIDLQSDGDGLVSWFDRPEDCMWSVTGWGLQALRATGSDEGASR